MDQKRALGRGLSSLIPGGSRSDNAGKTLQEIPLADIIANPGQPRKLFAKEAIDELAASIEEKGVLQPLLVRPIGGGKYELIAGERRYRASKQVGLDVVPVIVKDIGDEDVFEIALIENIQRENLNVIEEALAYRDLLSKFQYTQDELAKRLGKDRSTIANALRLLKLPDKIREDLINGVLSMGHARAVLAVEDRELQFKLAREIAEKQLSVRDTEVLAKRYNESFPEYENNFDGSADGATATGDSNTVARLPSGLTSLESRLKDKLRVMVRLQGTTKKGKITIAFSSELELNAIAEKLLN